MESGDEGEKEREKERNQQRERVRARSAGVREPLDVRDATEDNDRVMDIRTSPTNPRL